MMQYLLRFESETQAFASLPDWQDTDNGEIFWVPKVHSGILPTKVSIPEVGHLEGEDWIVDTPAIPFTSYYLIISRPEIDDELYAQPKNGSI